MCNSSRVLPANGSPHCKKLQYHWVQTAPSTFPILQNGPWHILTPQALTPPMGYISRSPPPEWCFCRERISTKVYTGLNQLDFIFESPFWQIRILASTNCQVQLLGHSQAQATGAGGPGSSGIGKYLRSLLLEPSRLISQVC